MVHKVYADAQGTATVDVYKHIKQEAGYEFNRNGVRIHASNDGKNVQDTKLQYDINQVIDASPDWLPFAAEAYNISSDIKDYVMVSVVAVPSDLPNRNCVAFPLSELTKFNPEIGMLAYQSWKGMPTHVEHRNEDYTKAKGVIFGATLRPLKSYQGDLWKVVLLLGFDRNRDPLLANNILNGTANSYSMGAYANDYECSICSKKLDRAGCEHTNPFNPSMKVVDGRLAYAKANGIRGFECSSVGTPAWVAAESNQVFTY